MSATDTGKIKLQDSGDIAKWLFTIVDGTIYESPIDVNIGKATEIDLPPLVWHNFDLVPKKMKLTNTGHTIILSGKWYQERPHLTGGPLIGSYVFSQLHVHWGGNDMEGSEHSVDGVRHPMEMHVIFFRSCYLTQEAALKERDGVVMLAYFYKLHTSSSPVIQLFTDNLKEILKPFTSVRIDPTPLSTFMNEFSEDYLSYWGSVSTSTCVHYILWILCRQACGLTADQTDLFRTVLDVNDHVLERNFRSLQPFQNRLLFHVCPSGSKYATLLPVPTDMRSY